MKKSLCVFLLLISFFTAFAGNDVLKKKLMMTADYISSMEIRYFIRKGYFTYREIKTFSFLKKNVKTYLIKFSKPGSFNRVVSLIILEYKGKFFPPSSAIESSECKFLLEESIDWERFDFSEQSISELADLILSRSYFVFDCDNNKKSRMEKLIWTEDTFLFIRYVYIADKNQIGDCLFRKLFVLYGNTKDTTGRIEKIKMIRLGL